MADGQGTLGEIRFFAGPFAPKNWAYCQGQLIAIRSNTALFSVLGTNYGGDGKVTFALPNLSGNMALGAGNTAEPWPLGSTDGNNTVVLGANNMPPHTHVFQGTVTKLCTQAVGNSDTPQATSPAELADETEMYSTTSDGSLMAAMQHNITVGSTGQSVPFTTIQPMLGLTAIICLNGLFPVRN